MNVMRIIVSADYDEMSKLAAEDVAGIIRENPTVVLGLPTGSTPLGMYRNLITMHKQGTCPSGTSPLSTLTST